MICSTNIEEAVKDKAKEYLLTDSNVSYNEENDIYETILSSSKIEEKINSVNKIFDGFKVASKKGKSNIKLNVPEDLINKYKKVRRKGEITFGATEENIEEKIKRNKEILDDFDKGIELTSIERKAEIWDSEKGEYKSVTKRLGKYVVSDSLKKKYKLPDDYTIAHRISERKDRIATALYGMSNKLSDEEIEYTARIGTLTHGYAELMMKKLIYLGEKGRELKLDKNELDRDIKKLYKNHPDFEDYKTAGDAFFTLGEKQFKELVRGVTNLYMSIVKEDKNAIIKTEQKIHDPDTNTGGTIDLLVLWSDGKVSLFDYKTMWLKSTATGKLNAVDINKKLIFSAQLSDYQTILAKALGLDEVNDFKHVRVVPIHRTYKWNKIENKPAEHGISYLRMYDGTTYTQALKQIPSETERKSNERGINELLNKLVRSREVLRKKAEVTVDWQEKQFLLQQVDKTQESIEKIQLEGEVTFLLNDLYTIVEDIKNNINKFSLSKINQYVEKLNSFSGMSVLLEEQMKKLDPKDKKDMSILRKQDSIEHRILSSLSTLNQRIIHLLDLKTTPDGKIHLQELDLLDYQFNGLGDYNNPIFNLLREELSESFYKSMNDHSDFNRDLEKIHNNYQKWAKSRGKAGINAFSLITETTPSGEKRIITRYTKEFWKEIDDSKEKLKKEYNSDDFSKMKNSPHYKFLKSWYEFDKKAYKEARKTHKDKLEDTLYTKAEKADLLKKWDKNNNPELNPYLYTYNKARFLRIKQVDTGKYINPKWKELSKPENSAAMEYINFWSESMYSFMKLIGFGNISNQWIPEIKADNLDLISEKGVLSLLKNSKSHIDSLKSSFQTKESNDSVHGVILESGEKLDMVPLLYSDDLKVGISTGEEKTIEKEMIRDGYSKEDIHEWTGEKKRRTKKLEYQKGNTIKSIDLSKSLSLFASSVFQNHRLNETLDVALALRHLINSKEVIEEEKKTAWNQIIKWLIPDKKAVKKGASTYNIEAFDTFLKLHYFGQRYQGKQFLGKDGVKAIKDVNTLMSFMYIAFSPILGAASHYNARVNFIVNGKKGRYYTEKVFKEAMNTFSDRDPKVAAIIDGLMMSSTDVVQKKARDLGAGTINKYLNIDNAFLAHRGKSLNPFRKDKLATYGDEFMDNLVTIAVTKQWVLDSDNRIKNPTSVFHKIKDPDAKSIYDLYKKNEDGKWEFPDNMPVEEIARLRDIISKFVEEIKGTTTWAERSPIDTSISWFIMMKFRRWLPGLVKARFGKFKIDSRTQEGTIGHFRAFWQELNGGLLNSTFRVILPMLADAASLGLYEYKVNKDRLGVFYQKYKKLYPEEMANVELEDFVEFQRKHLKAFITEFRIMALMGGLVLVLSGLGWDDDEESTIAQRAFHRTLKRTVLELTFFWSVGTVKEFNRDIIPMFRVFTDFMKAGENFVQESAEAFGLIDENKRDTTPFGYYSSKMIPFLNRVLDYSGVYNQRYNDKSLVEAIIFG